jgi:hypothetical protein
MGGIRIAQLPGNRMEWISVGPAGRRENGVLDGSLERFLGIPGLLLPPGLASEGYGKGTIAGRSVFVVLAGNKRLLRCLCFAEACWFF